VHNKQLSFSYANFMVKSTVEAASILHLERSTLSRWVKEGRLTPALKLAGATGAFLFNRAEIEALRDGEAQAS
jgi:excisionase family DNA binding protein